MGKLIFAVALFVVGVAGFRILKRMAGTAEVQREPGLARGLALGAKALLAVGVLVPSLVVVLSIFQIISAGHVGVKVLFGKVDPTPLREGLNIIWNPLIDVVDMDARVQKHTAKYDAASKDLQAVHVNMVLNYRLMPDRAPEVYRSIGHEFGRVIIDPAAQEILKANTALHNAAEILIKRPALKNDIQKDLTIWLARYGIDLREVALENIRFDPNYEKAIEAKQIEEQKAEQRRYELIQAQRGAEIAAAKAKGLGDAAREEARGVAEATRIRGEAEAAYNSKVAMSLTPTLIQQQYLTKWDGRLPQFMLDSRGGSGMLIQLPVPATEQKK